MSIWDVNVQKVARLHNDCREVVEDGEGSSRKRRALSTGARYNMENSRYLSHLPAVPDVLVHAVGKEIEECHKKESWPQDHAEYH
jgi:hypothetical protein